MNYWQPINQFVFVFFSKSIVFFFGDNMVCRPTPEITKNRKKIYNLVGTFNYMEN